MMNKGKLIFLNAIKKSVNLWNKPIIQCKSELIINPLINSKHEK